MAPAHARPSRPGGAGGLARRPQRRLSAEPLSNSPDPAVREAVVRQDLGNVLHPSFSTRRWKPSRWSSRAAKARPSSTPTARAEPWVEFAPASPLEGTGFELLVPRREARDFRSIPEQLRADDLNRSRR